MGVTGDNFKDTTRIIRYATQVKMKDSASMQLHYLLPDRLLAL